MDSAFVNTLLRKRVRELELENEILEERLHQTSQPHQVLESELSWKLAKATREQTRNFMLTWLSVVTLFFGALAVLGFDNLRLSLIERFPIEELKTIVLAAAQKEVAKVEESRKRIEEFEASIERTVSTLEESLQGTEADVSQIRTALTSAKKELGLIEEYRTEIGELEATVRAELRAVTDRATKTDELVAGLDRSIERYRANANDVLASLKVLTVESSSIRDSLPDPIQRQVRKRVHDRFLKLFSLTSASISLVAEKLLGEPIPHSEWDRSQVARIQSQLGLTPDGILGPATALLVSVEAHSVNPAITERDLAESPMHDQPRLTEILRAVYGFDAERILSIYENETDPLHDSLRRILFLLEIEPDSLFYRSRRYTSREVQPGAPSVAEDNPATRKTELRNGPMAPQEKFDGEQPDQAVEGENGR
jgi:regulator of replication initiation timing